MPSPFVLVVKTIFSSSYLADTPLAANELLSLSNMNCFFASLLRFSGISLDKSTDISSSFILNFRVSPNISEYLALADPGVLSVNELTSIF
ncbi:hypothetical protein D3C81_1823670 [compost metagenome]